MGRLLCWESGAPAYMVDFGSNLILYKSAG